MIYNLDFHNLAARTPAGVIYRSLDGGEYVFENRLGQQFKSGISNFTRLKIFFVRHDWPRFEETITRQNMA